MFHSEAAEYMIKDILRLSAILLITCGVCTALVSSANSMTKTIIEARANQQILDSYRQVLPAADSITKQPPSSSNTVLLEVCRSEHNGAVNGYIYTVAPNGYGGPIIAMVGIEHPTSRITGVKVLQQTETPGLGAKCKDPEFMKQFIDKSLTEPLVVSKQAAKTQEEILAITAATITSKAVVSGINAARDHYRQHYTVNH